MKKLLVLLTAFLLVLAGCSSATTTTTEDPCLSDDGTYDITFLSDLGGINDKSFNQSTWEGVQKYCIDNTEVTATYIETTDGAQYETNLQLASDQSEIVVVSGNTFATPVYNVASVNPETSYILIDAEPTDANGQTQTLDNVMSYYFAEQEAGYLVGYIAAKTSKTGHIAFIGGMPYPNVSKFAYGFIYGAQMANPDVIVDVQYAMTFSDSAKGQTMANAMYSNGADVIFSAAGGTGIGVMNETVQRKQNGEDVWAIGVDKDQYTDGTYTAEDGSEASAVLTSAVKNVGTAAYNGLDAYFGGTWAGGSVTTLSYADGGVGLPATNPNLDAALIEEAITSLEKNIDSIPDTLESTKETVNMQNVLGELQ